MNNTPFEKETIEMFDEKFEFVVEKIDGLYRTILLHNQGVTAEGRYKIKSFLLSRLHALSEKYRKEIEEIKIEQPAMSKTPIKIMEVDEGQAKLLRKKFGNSEGIPHYFFRDDRNCFHFYPRAAKGLLIRQKAERTSTPSHNEEVEKISLRALQIFKIAKRVHSAESCPHKGNCLKEGEALEMIEECLSTLRHSIESEVRETLGKEIVEALEKAKSNLPGKYAIYYDGFLEGKSKAQSIVSAITHNKENK